MLVGSKAQQERKPRPHPEQALKCPRCDSTNTKFCYYNNYSLTQPRYFCKACRRYWTKGGTLRNVPVGGGCRKNKRSSSSSSSTPSSSNSSLTSSLLSKRGGLMQDHHNPLNSNPLALPLPFGAYDSDDLTLAFARLQKGGQLGFDHGDHHDHHLSILGHPSNDMLGNGNQTSAGGSFLDVENGGSCGAGSVGISGGGGGGDHQNMGGVGYDHQEMMNNATTTSAVTVTTIKQELCNGNNVVKDVHNQSHENRGGVLWGCPWQLSNVGDHHGMGDFDAAGPD
ncbi:hypothetical protein TIFTF001_000617 [Ficus carica]|uniref:Dof zinc finger protein n=1 Tax=Ficus carica TaxID=3494 RepID=A0AA88CNF8_FICCA|nr:hypothetical protein TIFTF001_000617 [Ficus carica]